MEIITKEATWINPLNVYCNARCRAEKLGATIVLGSDHDEIYQINQRTHMAPFCTTSNPSDRRGNTPYLVKLKEDALIEDWIQTIEDWIAKELEYKRSKGY